MPFTKQVAGLYERAVHPGRLFRSPTSPPDDDDNVLIPPTEVQWTPTFPLHNLLPGSAPSFHDASSHRLTRATERVSPFDNRSTALLLPRPPEGDRSDTSFLPDNAFQHSRTPHSTTSLSRSRPTHALSASQRCLTSQCLWCDAFMTESSEVAPESLLAMSVNLGLSYVRPEENLKPTSDLRLPLQQSLSTPERLTSPGLRSASNCASLRSVGW